MFCLNYFHSCFTGTKNAMTGYLKKFHSKCEAFMWSETTGRHKNLDLGFRTNWLLINVKAKGILISSQNICKTFIAGSCIYTAFEFCRHHLSILVHFFQGEDSDWKENTAIYSQALSLIWFIAFASMNSAWVLVCWWHLCMSIIMPLFLLFRELHLIRSVFSLDQLLEQQSYPCNK